MTPRTINNTELFDIIVIGAGFCGTIIGLAAARRSLSILVIDAHAEYPDHFRAEKLEADQCEALESLGMMSFVRPLVSPPISKVHTFTGDRESVSTHDGHRGMRYSETVNALRDSLLKRQILEVGRVTSIKDGDDCCEVVIDEKLTRRARLVVMATGMEAGLRQQLDVQNVADEKLVSTTFGFEIESVSERELPYLAFNFRPRHFIEGLHYITFFPIGDRRRANLFTCWEATSGAVRRLKVDMHSELRALFPDLERRIGAFDICTAVQSYTTRYYRMNGNSLRRVVLVGDACQSVNPANGVGLSKCLTDAQVLLELMPQLLNSPDDPIDLHAYYGDARKIKVDNEGLNRWLWANESTTSRSLKTRLKRSRIYAAGPVRNCIRVLRRALGQ